MEASKLSQLVYNNSIKSTKKYKLDDRVIIPYFSLYSDRIVVHPKPFMAVTKRKVHQNSLKNLKKQKFTGNLSQTQKSTIKKKLTAWLTSIESYNYNVPNRFTRKEHYPVFITLTLSAKQFHSDQDIKRKLLDLFIKNLKNLYSVKNYFWRAEPQNNGNIHFHLIIDKYVPYVEAKNIWNKIQNKLGYIKKFKEIHNHINPNSVDIRSAASVKNFVNYVLKYALKSEDKRKIEGRVFGMSDSLRELSVYQSELDSYIGDQVIKYSKHNYFEIYKQEYATVIYFKEEFYRTSFFKQLQELSAKYYISMYRKLYINKKEDMKKHFEFKKRQIEKPIQLTLFGKVELTKRINNYNFINKKDEKKFRNREIEQNGVHSHKIRE